MGPNDIPGFDKAQWEYDNQTPEDFETEDDIPHSTMEDIREEEEEEKYFREKYG